MGEMCLFWFIYVHYTASMQDAVNCILLGIVCISFPVMINMSFLSFCRIIICSSEFTILKTICRQFPAVITLDPHCEVGGFLALNDFWSGTRTDEFPLPPVEL